MFVLKNPNTKKKNFKKTFLVLFDFVLDVSWSVSIFENDHVTVRSVFVVRTRRRPATTAHWSASDPDIPLRWSRPGVFMSPINNDNNRKTQRTPVYYATAGTEKIIYPPPPTPEVGRPGTVKYTCQTTLPAISSLFSAKFSFLFFY